MGKHSTKEMVEVGERVLAKVLRGKSSTRKRALQARWEEAIWVGVARKSNEHIVILEDGGSAIRCRTVKRRPITSRWSAERLEEIEVTPRWPKRRLRRTRT